jgi:DNA-3-methyladenine glycosylase II
MSTLIDRVGPCALRPRRDRFTMLVRSIVGQQISAKAAAAINGRLHALAGQKYTPGGLLAVGEEELRSVGVSRVKAGTILNLAGAVATGHVPLQRIGRWDDDAIIARLITVKGIGVWTAEMFLIFALNRPDVLPVTDLGIRVGLRDWHGLAEVPGPVQCRTLAEPWRPYRTVACWYLWRSRDTTVPKPAAVTTPQPAAAPVVTRRGRTNE